MLQQLLASTYHNANKFIKPIMKMMKLSNVNVSSPFIHSLENSQVVNFIS